MKLQLNSDFETAINDLPEVYDEKAYTRFLNYFGTHYVIQLIMGGKYEVLINED